MNANGARNMTAEREEDGVVRHPDQGGRAAAVQLATSGVNDLNRRSSTAMTRAATTNSTTAIADAYPMRLAPNALEYSSCP